MIHLLYQLALLVIVVHSVVVVYRTVKFFEFQWLDVLFHASVGFVALVFLL